jgi:outer membrane protein OmpA-like peptidoglycan-associated protein
MKKLVLLFAAAVLAVSASAQTVEESKTFDNIYVGINGGLATKTTGHAWMKGLDPNFGVRIGRNFTPVLGAAIESNAYFSNKPWASTGTVVRFLNTSLLGTVNLSNWFGGYLGQPRPFEVSVVAGLGWGHLFGNSALYKKTGPVNDLTSKVALDFAFNLGADKAWQVYVEPAIMYGLNDLTGSNYNLGNGDIRFDVNHSFVQLNAGVIYKFKNSNGTHNFKIAQLRDQSEIDGLNSQISDLRNELAKKPKEVIKEVIKEVPAETSACPLFVTFAQGKANLTNEAKKVLDNVTKGAAVEIVGTASPEGSSKVNKQVSQIRANNVAKYLKSRGVVVKDATGKGVQGVTSNRLAVVYVK